MQLETLYRLDAQGMITATREPGASLGPRFALIRATTGIAWAVRAGTPPDVYDRLAALLASEPPITRPGDEPRHAAAYLTAVGGRVVCGPAYTFPKDLSDPARRSEVVVVEDIEIIDRRFVGWSQDEIQQRQPIMGVLEDGQAVSLCFCARRSEGAAEAGVETAEPYRGRGLGPLVAAAWAAAMRREGHLPIYSTQWNNSASLAVARKLGLQPAADNWNIIDT